MQIEIVIGINEAAEGYVAHHVYVYRLRRHTQKVRGKIYKVVRRRMVLQYVYLNQHLLRVEPHGNLENTDFISDIVEERMRRHLANPSRRIWRVKLPSG